MYTQESMKTFVCSEAFAQHILVKRDAAGTVSIADLTDTPIGVSQSMTNAANEEANIRLLNGGGTIEMVAAAAITNNAVVYGRADGKISSDSSGSAVRIGIALEAASGDGARIEVLPD